MASGKKWAAKKTESGGVGAQTGGDASRPMIRPPVPLEKSSTQLPGLRVTSLMGERVQVGGENGPREEESLKNCNLKEPPGLQPSLLTPKLNQALQRSE